MRHDACRREQCCTAQITSCHTTPYHTTSHHLPPHADTPHHTPPQPITSHHTTPHHTPQLRKREIFVQSAFTSLRAAYESEHGEDHRIDATNIHRIHQFIDKPVREKYTASDEVGEKMKTTDPERYQLLESLNKQLERRQHRRRNQAAVPTDGECSRHTVRRHTGAP